MAIKRGAMTDAERAEIDRYAESTAKPSPTAIARRLNRHHGTVFWYMLNKGYLQRTLSYANAKPYQRGNKTVYPYTEPEDRRILALRVEGNNPKQIAAIATSEFGRPRSGHSIDVRLKFLAAYENSPDRDRRR